MPRTTRGGTAAAAGRAARLAIHLAIRLAALLRVLTIRLTIHLAIAATSVAAPGTTELLVISVVKGDRGVNAAGPGCICITIGKRRLLWRGSN